MPLPKKKRVSKKNKSSWRKHVDITDVENFLDEQRFEERLGKPSEKLNEELFIIDKEPSGVNKLTSKIKKRLILKEKFPKCFSMLQPHSEVPDPIIKRNRVRTKEERKSKLVKQMEERNRKCGLLKRKELQSIKDRELDLIKRSKKHERVEFIEDIWDAKENDKGAVEWITESVFKHTLRGTGKSLKNIPKSIHTKPSILKSIETPHPGTSYNPTFHDHQELLQKVVEDELKIIQKEKHLKRVTSGMYSKVTADERNNNWLIEMSQGLEKDEENITNLEDKEYKAINPPVQNKKKNLKQRRIQKEQIQLEQLRKNAKKEKRKIADIYKLKHLKDQLAKTDKKAAKLRLKRLKKKTYIEKEPKRLSILKFEEQEIDFNAPQLIKGTLRNLNQEGNLLLDRFKSLQRRNILQPTAIQTHKRAKIKRFQRQDHKDDWKSTIARAYNKIK